MHLLFVCTGNICRSPTAERLAAAYAARLECPHFTVASAGTLAIIAHPIHQQAAIVLEALGGDTSEFYARQLTPKIASDADLILTMTTVHRDEVLSLAPHRLNQTFTFLEAARLISDFDAKDVGDLARFRAYLPPHALLDIPDPLGHSARHFAKVGSQIADFLPSILSLCLR